MKDLLIYLRLPRYLREWLEFHLGTPVRFPERSYENELLHTLLTKRPASVQPVKPTADSVALVITDCRHRKPEHYNYLGIRGQRVMISSIEGLFRLDLWSSCAGLIHSKGELNKGLDEWCAKSGISLDAREAVRQKFYRMRREYQAHGIVVGKCYQKRLRT